LNSEREGKKTWELLSMISSVVDEVSKSATMGEEGAIVKLDLV